MVNLYQILGLKHTATDAEIKQAIAHHYANGIVKEPVLAKAKEWLLNPTIRAKYDAQLLATFPDLNKVEPKAEKVYGSLYDFLGISVDATVAEIQQAITSLESQNADARQLNLAKNYLLNQERRKTYDKQQGIEKKQVQAKIINKLPKKKPAQSQVQQPQQIVVKNTGCFGVAGGIILAIVILIIAPILLLGMCTVGGVAAIASKADEVKTERENIPTPVTPKTQPIVAANGKEQEVCRDNGGFKGCYGLAFECSDGHKIKPEKAACMDGVYVSSDTDKKISQSSDDKLENAKLEFCEKFAKAAKTAMDVRQKGTAKTDAMAIAEKNPILASLVNDAYKHPIMETDALKRNAIDLYENKMHRQCIDTM